MSTPTRPLLRVDANAFGALRDETAQITGLIPALIEKDYWVTEVLRAVVVPLSGADLVVFKGGTSLSKPYNIIERFSEDIDLIVSTSLTSNAQLLRLPVAHSSRSIAVGM
ncbi:MAG: nucleotidyl transferase AbiEii/AbiGii toxin family protein [Acidimicrobiales bacterium]